LEGGGLPWERVGTGAIFFPLWKICQLWIAFPASQRQNWRRLTHFGNRNLLMLEKPCSGKRFKVAERFSGKK
jgi:hypothetical protein